jgi:hypothetical protein
MNGKYVVVVVALAVMLVAATTIATTTTDNAFAERKKGGHSTSQALADAIDCGNGDPPVDVFCQNLPSQTRGDGNAGINFGKQG